MDSVPSSTSGASPYQNGTVFQLQEEFNYKSTGWSHANVLLNLFTFSEKSYRFAEKSECLCQPNGWGSHLGGGVFASFLLVSLYAFYPAVT